MNLELKTCIVTGANSGIGKQTAKALVSRGAYVIMLCRNEERAEQARQQIMDETGQSGVEILLADLAHQYDIRKAAEQFCERFDTLDILINNAGIIPRERDETPQGIERTLAVNHLGPFLLTNLLMEPLQKAPAARVVNVASEVHRLGAAIFDIDNLQLTTGYSPLKAYGLSKLCNIMFSRELAKRTADTAITANALHPGVVSTQLADKAGIWMKFIYLVGKPFMRSPERGAQTSIFLATSEEAAGTSGKYFKNKKISSPASVAYDDEVIQELWEKSEQLCGLG